MVVTRRRCDGCKHFASLDADNRAWSAAVPVGVQWLGAFGVNDAVCLESFGVFDAKCGQNLATLVLCEFGKCHCVLLRVRLILSIKCANILRARIVSKPVYIRCRGMENSVFYQYSLFFGLRERTNKREHKNKNTRAFVRYERGKNRKLKRGVYIFIYRIIE